MTIIGILALIALFFAALPALLYFRNVRVFRSPSPSAGEGFGVRGTPQCISVLIPARNEESGIAACLESILANAGIEFEVIVLDDSSTDRTAEIAKQIAMRDQRVRLETAPPLPDGWCGKQHACFQLSKLAKYEVLSFLDADVRLSSTALLNMVGFLESSKAALVSGFPKQEMGTFLERLIIPLINWLLLSYLPFDRMRKDLSPSLGAGCGQWFTTTKTAYEKVGGHGHEIVKASMHDGIKLPRAYRMNGLMTDVCDATHDATCRMYKSAGQVWNGFAKNAREGMGGPIAIWIWTLLLGVGSVLPWVLALFTASIPLWETIVVFLAGSCSMLTRRHAYVRFKQSFLGGILHPLGVLLLLAIQWCAAIRSWLGRPVGWKGRGSPSLS